MNVIEATLRRITGDLGDTGHPWALMGGFAVSARAEPRFTRDVDVAVGVLDDSAAEELIHSLMSKGYRILASVEQDSAERLATVRLTLPESGGVSVDILFASSGIEPEIVGAAESLEILPGLTVPVTAVGHLFATKLLARDDETRPQDLADLRALREVATEADMSLARDAIERITERGFHRGRDLATTLEAFLGS